MSENILMKKEYPDHQMDLKEKGVINKNVENALLYFVGCGAAHLISLIICNLYNVSNLPFWIFYIPLIYFFLIQSFLFFKIYPPFFKEITRVTAILILCLNPLWVLYVSHQHNNLINGFMLVFGILFLNVAVLLIREFGEKAKLIIGLLYIFLGIGYFKVFMIPIQQDDLLALHFFWVSILFFSIVNHAIHKKILVIKKIKYDLEVSNIELDIYSKNINQLYKEIKDQNKKLELKNIKTEEDHKELSKMNKMIKEYSENLENLVLERTQEVKELLDNVNAAVFSVNENYIIQSPVSKYSEEIFEQNIIGRNIVDILFFNIKKGTIDHTNLFSAFSIIFGEDKFQFLLLKDQLPKQVILPHGKNIKGKTLKLTYAPILNRENKVDKFMCIAEDITQSDTFFKEAQSDQINLQFIREIIEKENKEEIAKILEVSIFEVIEVLDDFVSPLSDTYDDSYFKKTLKDCITTLHLRLKDLVSLDEKLNQIRWDIVDWEGYLDQEVNAQLEGTSLVCRILDALLNYASNTSLFFPVQYRFEFPFLKVILEKIADVEKVFKNLFEYVFLVRDINSIDGEKLQKVVKLAKLYPEFDRTIDLIHQRSKLLSFLLKSIMEKDISEAFDNLSILVKQIPGRTKLSAKIIKRNLIDPYKIILYKTAYIEVSLPNKLKKFKSNYFNDNDYLNLLLSILKRFLQEDREKQNENLLPLPPCDHKKIEMIREMIKSAETKIKDCHKEEQETYIKIFNFRLEVFLKTIFEKKLIESNILVFNKEDKAFIKFLKQYLLEKEDL